MDKKNYKDSILDATDRLSVDFKNLAESDESVDRMHENYVMGKSIGISDDAAHLLGFFLGKMAKEVERDRLKEYFINTIDIVYDIVKLGGN